VRPQKLAHSAALGDDDSSFVFSSTNVSIGRTVGAVRVYFCWWDINGHSRAASDTEIDIFWTCVAVW